MNVIDRKLEYRENVYHLQGKFIEDYHKRNWDSKKIGELLFLFHDTYGINHKLGMEVVEERFNKKINKAWGDVVKEALEYVKEKYETKGQR